MGISLKIWVLKEEKSVCNINRLAVYLDPAILQLFMWSQICMYHIYKPHNILGVLEYKWIRQHGRSFMGWYSSLWPKGHLTRHKHPFNYCFFNMAGVIHKGLQMDCWFVSSVSICHVIMCTEVILRRKCKYILGANIRSS